MTQSRNIQSHLSDQSNRTAWFDLTPLFGAVSIRAFLSQKDSHSGPVPLGKQRDELAWQLGLTPEYVAVPHQVHGANVDMATAGRVHPHTDGLFTHDPSVILSLQVADCAPIFFYHKSSGYRGLVHAGWRGLVAGIITASCDFLQAQGVNLQEVQVVIGPTIEMECYEVGPEVANLFPPLVRKTNSNGRYQLNLLAAVREQLTNEGILAAKIGSARVCTRCDSRCHSYRRDGQSAGRMIGFFYEQR